MSNEQPEGADSVELVEELLPCPFCGGEAKRVTLSDPEPDAGGDVIYCTGVCGASSHVEFGFKENLVSLWNTRLSAEKSGEQPAPLAGVERLILVQRLFRFRGGTPSAPSVGLYVECCREADAILAAIQRPPAAPSEVEQMEAMIAIQRRALLAVRDWQGEQNPAGNTYRTPIGFKGSPFDYLRKLANDGLKESARIAWGIDEPARVSLETSTDAVAKGVDHG